MQTDTMLKVCALAAPPCICGVAAGTTQTSRENRERSANLRQDRCCEAEPWAIAIDPWIEKGPGAMKPSQKTCL